MKEEKRRGVARVERLLLVAYFALLLLVGLLLVGQIGITWDEPNYFTSTYSYFSWFGHVAAEPSDWWASIDRYWEQSHEAPPFFKLWAGLFAGGAALVFGAEDLSRLGDAYRVGSYALFLFATFAAFRFARQGFGRAAGWGAALSMPLVPPLFGFARLGQLDGAAASMYLLSAFALHGMLVRGGRRRVAWAGVLLGLAFATKLSVFPLAPAALAWAFVYLRGRELGLALVRLFASFGIGAGTFFVLWPWLWREPVGRTLEFLTWAGGLQDERFTFYLGRLWAGAPFHYPPVTLLVMVPLAVAVAGVAGVARLSRLSRRARNPAAGWLLIHLSLVVAVAGSGLVPVYGGPRQFLPAFALWAVCAGVGAGWLASGISSRLVVRHAGREGRWSAAGLAVYAALCLPGIVWTGTANSLEYYGETVGLAPGARLLGFETTYLADTYAPAVEWVSRVAPEGATVYGQAGTYPVLESYRRLGTLRKDLRPAYLAPIAPDDYVSDEEPREGSYFLFLPRQSIYTRQMLALEGKEPLYAHEKGGVPLAKVYSGKAVSGTLGVKGAPEAHDVGPLNAVVAGGGFIAVLLALARGQKQQGEEREEEQVARGEHGGEEG